MSPQWQCHPSRPKAVKRHPSCPNAVIRHTKRLAGITHQTLPPRHEWHSSGTCMTDPPPELMNGAGYTSGRSLSKPTTQALVLLPARTAPDDNSHHATKSFIQWPCLGNVDATAQHGQLQGPASRLYLHTAAAASAKRGCRPQATAAGGPHAQLPICHNQQLSCIAPS